MKRLKKKKKQYPLVQELPEKICNSGYRAKQVYSNKYSHLTKNL